MNPSSAPLHAGRSATSATHPAAAGADAAQAAAAAAPAAATGQAARPRIGAGNTALGVRTPAAGLQEPVAKRLRSSDHFSSDEKKALKDAEKVLVLEYSSTGGGHTARSLDPIVMAARAGTFAPKDCVVIVAPPRWQHDKDGGKVNKLHEKVEELRAEGLTVMVKQGDKTVTGLYKHNGDSDNVRMLLDFVNKPKRDSQATALSAHEVPRQMLEPDAFPKGPGTSTRQLLKEVVDAVGARAHDKIAVLGDMAPALQKAAQALGLDRSLEIGNHQTLFIGDGRARMGDKDLAYLHKASGGGHAQKLALVEYSDAVNVVQDLAPTMQALGITETMSKADARNVALQHLLQHGRRLDPTPGARVEPGILVPPGAQGAQDVKAMVYLYVNEYTAGAVNHIRQQMQQHPETFGKSLFAVCGAGAIGADAPRGTGNILQVMYAANADGVTNAGFGTTSEYHYMANQGYKGDFVAFPVVNQHEQEANAAILSAEVPGRVTDASGPAQTMYAGLAALVDRRCAQASADAHLGGPGETMADLFAASNSETSGAQHAADLLASLYADDAADAEPMRPNATAAIEQMQAYDAAQSAKQSRRVIKLFVPALDALRQGNESCEVRATQKQPSTTLSVAEVANHLRAIANPNGGAAHQAAAELMGIGAQFDSARARTLAGELGETLAALVASPNTRGRRQAADAALVAFAERNVALGW